MATLTVRQARIRRHRRVRKNVQGTAERPRLVVFRSNRGIEAQLDRRPRREDRSPQQARSISRRRSRATSSDQAAEVGKALAAAAKSAGVETVVFDRAGYLFHGRIKALADAAREGGLKF